MFDEIHCCCQGVDVCCCEEPLSTTYTAEVRDPSNNVVATVAVNYNTTTERWETAAFTAGPCAIDSFWFACAPEPFCQWEGYIQFTGGGGTNNALLRISVVCDPFVMNWKMESANCLDQYTIIVT